MRRDLRLAKLEQAAAVITRPRRHMAICQAVEERSRDLIVDLNAASDAAPESVPGFGTDEHGAWVTANGGVAYMDWLARHYRTSACCAPAMVDHLDEWPLLEGATP